MPADGPRSLPARDGDHSDGGGVYLRVRESSASWLFRYTSTSDKRRGLGLGKVQRTDAAAADASLTTARADATTTRSLVAAGKDPIDLRDEQAAAAKQAKRTSATAANAPLLQLNLAANAAAQALARLALSSGGSGAGLLGCFGTGVSALSSTTSTAGNSINAGSGFTAEAIELFSAMGNVFNAGNVVPFANGGIVDRPTIFPMRNGGKGMMRSWTRSDHSVAQG